MEKTVEVEIADGKKEIVTLKRILRRERRELNKTLFADKFDAHNPVVMVSSDTMEEYKDKLVFLSIKEPSPLKNQTAISNLTDIAFQELFKAAQEVNGDSFAMQESMEKK